MGMGPCAVEDAARGRTAAVRFLVRGVSMKRTAHELASAVGASLEGDGSIEINGVAAPERASSGDLIFVDSTKHAERAGTSAALCVVVTEGISIYFKTFGRHKEVQSFPTQR